MPADTFKLTLPDGKKVDCLRREAELIRKDVNLTGNVYLRETFPGSELYVRIDPGDVEAMRHTMFARRIG